MELERGRCRDALRAYSRIAGGVSHLTSYLDEKTARVLTAVAFISTLAAIAYDVLGRDIVPLHSRWLNLYFNLLFYAYGTLVALGAFCVISGIFPRLNIPPGWSPIRFRNPKPAAGDPQTGLPSSFLFAPEIAKSSPRGWAQAFVDANPEALKSIYVKDHIHETYLVAEQIPHKLGWLWVGMRAIQIANLILVIWFTLTAARLLLGT